MGSSPHFPHERFFTIPTFPTQETAVPVSKAPAQRVPDGAVVEADRMDDGALSPKVTVPAIAQAVLGVILVLLAVIPGLIKDESTQNTLLTLGLALLGASGVTGALGFTSRPGKVVVARTVR
jgi:hypothetical protein